MPTFGKFLAINALRITLMVQNSYFMLVKMCCYQKWCVFCDSLLVKMCLKIQFYVQTQHLTWVPLLCFYGSQVSVT